MKSNKVLYIILIAIVITIVGLSIAIILVTNNPTVNYSAGDYNDKIIELKETCGDSCANEILKYSREAYAKYQDYYTASLACDNETLYGDQETAKQYCEDAKRLLESSSQEDTLRD